MVKCMALSKHFDGMTCEVSKSQQPNSAHIIIGTPGRLVDFMERKDSNMAASFKALVCFNLV